MATSGESTLFRTCAPVVDGRYEEGDDRTIVETLINAVAKAEGVDAIDLPPLYETIDSDAIVQLIERQGETPDENTVLSFTFATWNVFVRSDGRIRVCDETQAIDPEPVFEKSSSA